MESWLLRTIGQVISNQRNVNQLTQPDLARRVQIPVRELVEIEHGRKEANLIVLNEICAAINMTLSELIQNATHLDDERMFIVTPAPELFGKLKAKHRDVVLLKRPEDLNLTNQRLDLLAVAPQFAELLQAQFQALERRGIPVLLLPEDDIDICTAVEQQISTTHKGMVCNLRRTRDALNERRKELSEQRAKLNRRRAELQAMANALKGRQPKFNPITAEDRLRSLESQLEQREKALREREEALAERETMNNERSRFLKRNADWINLGQYTEDNC